MGSYGQTLLREYLEAILGEKAEEDVRPDFLNGLELDIAFRRLNFAAEFQGDQHFLPLNGWTEYHRQRHNDKAKKRICEERGIGLLVADASNLEYTRLRRMVKKHLGKQPMRNRNRLRELNKLAIAYRKTLREKYDAPTTYRKTRGKRKAKRREWKIAHGIWVAPQLATNGSE